MTVRKVIVFLTMVGLLLLTAGPSMASEDEWYEHGRGYRGSSAKFYGVIESMPQGGYEGIWIVDGRKVLVTKQTFIEEEYGRATTGAYIEVKGYYEGDIFRAYKIEVKRAGNYKQSYFSKFYGVIEWMPKDSKEGVWIISGKAVKVGNRTRIKEEYGRLSIGATVEVKGNPSTDLFIASEIEVKGGK